MQNNKYDTGIDLLMRGGFTVSDEVQAKLKAYVALVREFNPVLSLVSVTDAERLFETHIVDSLSLVPVIGQKQGAVGTLLDIGSGGGFPAIPVKLFHSELSVVLIERSGKKVGFLRRVVGELGLTRVEAVEGPFPEAIPDERGEWITARAVERPGRMLRHVLARCKGDCRYLCQLDLRDNWPKKFHVEHIVDGFHVEPVHDEWERLGLRRGSLHVFSQKTGTNDPGR
jgi:16S rRNA (guanine(527)-N(7))-methyltransferase RsmG